MSNGEDGPLELGKYINPMVVEAERNAKVCSDIMDAVKDFSEREAKKEAHKRWVKDLWLALKVGYKRRTYNPRGGR